MKLSISSQIAKTIFKFTLLLALLLISFFNSISQTYFDSIGPSRPVIGLVLSGGGAKGFAHVGVLKVLEDAGIHPDIIAGSSMGSIVGGLYAIGYSTEYLENMIRTENWDNLLIDKIPRRQLSFEEKGNEDRFIIKAPISFKGIGMKPGLYTGQNIETMLTRLTSPIYKEKDFSHFPIPFFCIGTDLLTGEEVLLKNGDLDKAMRASMAIPSYFYPYHYQGRILVDGGVINNYPANRLKEMGVDIIIGVDVQEGLKKEDQLNTIFSVLDQITSFYRTGANEIGHKLTDYYIKPNMKDYGMLDFNSYDSILWAGEVAARKMLPQLKRLADSINDESGRKPKPIIHNTQPLDSINLIKIEVYGLQNIRKKLVLGKLNIEVPGYAKLIDIERGVQGIYGTRFFNHVNYRFESTAEGTILILDVEEINGVEVGAGLNMNSDYNAALFLNTTFRNIGIGGSKLFTDLVVGQNPRFKTLYIYDLGNKPGFGVNLDFHSFTIDKYNKTGGKENSYEVTNYISDVFTQISINNSLVIGLAGQYKRSRFNNKFPTNDSVFFDLGGGIFMSFLNAYFFLKVDTYNKSAFSTKGMKMNAELKSIGNIENDRLENYNIGSAVTYFFDYRQNISLNKRLTLKPGATFAGVINNKTPLITDWFGLGGQTEKNYSQYFIPFTGLNLIEGFGPYVLVGRAALQYNFARKHYITAKWDLGKVGNQLDDLFSNRDIISGYGLSYGYESFIGPVVLSIMGSNTNPKANFFINIGYWF